MQNLENDIRHFKSLIVTFTSLAVIQRRGVEDGVNSDVQGLDRYDRGSPPNNQGDRK